jgi:hypothetical protein
MYLEEIFAFWDEVPISKYSVFDGLTESKLEENQSYTESRVVESKER